MTPVTEATFEGYSPFLGPAAVVVLGAAFDEAWRTLQANGVQFSSDVQADAAREALAKHILIEAQRGERDLRRICEGALAHLTVSIAVGVSRHRRQYSLKMA